MSDNIETRREMLRAGYVLKSKATCKGCNAAIEWWRTTRGKMMPFDPIASDDVKAVPHWSTCPQRDRFKSTADKAADLRAVRENGAAGLLKSTNARAVIALYDDGLNALSWRSGIPGEELRDEAITAANKLRWNIITAGGKA
jgi:hypothetical protein